MSRDWFAYTEWYIVCLLVVFGRLKTAVSTSYLLNTSLSQFRMSCAECYMSLRGSLSWRNNLRCTHSHTEPRPHQWVTYQELARQVVQLCGIICTIYCYSLMTRFILLDLSDDGHWYFCTNHFPYIYVFIVWSAWISEWIICVSRMNTMVQFRRKNEYNSQLPLLLPIHINQNSTLPILHHVQIYWNLVWA